MSPQLLESRSTRGSLEYVLAAHSSSNFRSYHTQYCCKDIRFVVKRPYLIGNVICDHIYTYSRPYTIHYIVQSAWWCRLGPICSSSIYTKHDQLKCPTRSWSRGTRMTSIIYHRQRVAKKSWFIHRSTIDKIQKNFNSNFPSRNTGCNWQGSGVKYNWRQPTSTHGSSNWSN